MAITWDMDITNVDVAGKRANISFLRTDSVTGKTERYSFKKAIIETPEQRDAIYDVVWGEHEAAASEQVSIASFITNMEQDGKAKLTNREV